MTFPKQNFIAGDFFMEQFTVVKRSLSMTFPIKKLNRWSFFIDKLIYNESSIEDGFAYRKNRSA